MYRAVGPHFAAGAQCVPVRRFRPLCAQMGHADVSTTLKIYTHLDSVHKRKSVEKLDAYLSIGASSDKQA